MATYPNQEAVAVAETTPTGTAYERVTVRPAGAGGDLALMTVPASTPMGSDVVLVIACHGHGGSYNTFEAHAPSLGIRDRLTDDGYLFISPHMHGDSWGNSVALGDLLAAYTYASTHWNVTDVLLFGGSMGGLTAIQAYAHNTVPKVRGAVAVAPALNLELVHTIGAYTPSVRTAYGIASDGSDFTAKTAGYRPLDHNPEQYAGKRVRIYHSNVDASIPKETHSDLFVSGGLTAQMADFELLTMTGGHLAAGNYDAADTSVFYAEALAAAAPEPGVPGAPADVTAVKAWTGSEWATVVPKAWNGTAWVEITPTAYVPV